jgi:hypothetical protein
MAFLGKECDEDRIDIFEYSCLEATSFTANAFKKQDEF